MSARRHITTAGFAARATIDVTAIVAMGIAAAIAIQFDKMRKGVANSGLVQRRRQDALTPEDPSRRT